MRVAHKRGVRKSLIQPVIRHGLRSYFAGIHVRGNLTALRQSSLPILYFANHVSLWDFSISTHLTYVWLNQDPFVMTAEFTMLPPTDWAGAFSVNPLDSVSVTKTLRYSVNLLKTVPRCALWMFPQGMILPVNQRPLNFQSGISIIIKQVNDLLIIPVSFFYAFGNHSRPEAFVSFGEPFEGKTSQPITKLTRELEARLTQDLDHLSNDIASSNTEEFITVIYGKHDLRYYMLKLLRKPYPPLKSWGMWYQPYLQKDIQS